MKVTAELIQAFIPAGKALNIDQFRVSIIKENSPPSVKELCDSFKSSPTDNTVTYDPTSNTCITIGGTCVFPLILVGFEPNGGQMCGQFVPARCPFKYFMSAMDKGDGSAPATVTCNSCDPVAFPPIITSWGTIQ